MDCVIKPVKARFNYTEKSPLPNREKANQTINQKTVYGIFKPKPTCQTWLRYCGV